MERLRVILDRYDGTELAESLSLDDLAERGYVTARLGSHDDFEIHFDLPPTSEVLGRVKGLLREIGNLDNLVQMACAKECEATGHHPRNYEADLAYFTVKSKDQVLLRYFGTGVNTEWDELVEYCDDNWVLLGTQLPDLSARKV